MKTLLLDVDSFVYQMAWGHQQACEWTSELWTYIGDLSAAKIAMRQLISDLLFATECQSVVVALTCSQGNFRKLVVPTYKGNRLPGMRPVLFKPLRDMLRKEFGAIEKPWLEGDDVVAMLAGSDTVVCSIDKDLETVPCTLYNPNRPGILSTIEPQTAWLKFYTQVLTGDRTDGYPGCPGLGPVTAPKLFEEEPFDNWWPIVVRAYEDAGQSEVEALENARCAYLLRASDYKDDKVRLWTPPGYEHKWLKLEPLPADTKAIGGDSGVHREGSDEGGEAPV